MAEVKFNYSEEAEMLIENSKDFDRAEFEAKIIADGIAIGSRTIFEFIFWKCRLKKKNKKEKTDGK